MKRPRKTTPRASREPHDDYIPGLMLVTRPLLATSLFVLGAALAAVLVFVPFAGMSSFLGQEEAWHVVSKVSDGFTTPAYILLPVLAGAIVAIQVREPRPQRNERADAAIADERAGAQLVSWVLAVAGVAVGMVVQVDSYSELERVGEGLVIAVLVVVVILLATGIGTHVPPDARVQHRRARSEWEKKKRLVEELQTRGLPSRRAAMMGIVLRGILLVIGLPGLLLSWLLLGNASWEWLVVVMGTVMVLNVASVFGITWSLSSLSDSRRDRIFRRAGLIYACAGWLALGTFELYAFGSTRDTIWLIYALVFLSVGMLCVLAAWPRRRASRWSLHAAAWRLGRDAANSRIAALRRQCIDLERIINDADPRDTAGV